MLNELKIFCICLPHGCAGASTPPQGEGRGLWGFPQSILAYPLESALLRLPKIQALLSRPATLPPFLAWDGLQGASTVPPCPARANGSVGNGSQTFPAVTALGGGGGTRRPGIQDACATVMTCCILPDPYGGKLTLWQIYEDV